jgi:hypothetical protein
VERFALLIDSREAIIDGDFDTGDRRANRGGFDADNESIGALYDRARRKDGPLTFCALSPIVDDGEHRNTKAAESKNVTKDVTRASHGVPLFFYVLCFLRVAGALSKPHKITERAVG